MMSVDVLSDRLNRKYEVCHQCGHIRKLHFDDEDGCTGMVYVAREEKQRCYCWGIFDDEDRENVES